jgi:hypothetical protein
MLNPSAIIAERHVSTLMPHPATILSVRPRPRLLNAHVFAGLLDRIYPIRCRVAGGSHRKALVYVPIVVAFVVAFGGDLAMALLNHISRCTRVRVQPLAILRGLVGPTSLKSDLGLSQRPLQPRNFRVACVEGVGGVAHKVF